MLDSHVAVDAPLDLLPGELLLLSVETCPVSRAPLLLLSVERVLSVERCYKRALIEWAASAILRHAHLEEVSQLHFEPKLIVPRSNHQWILDHDEVRVVLL